MKFDDIVQTTINLSDNPSSALIPKLKKGDIVLYEGKECEIDMAPKKHQGTKGIWVVGLKEVKTGKKFGIKVIDSEKPSMTSYEKKVYKRNIKEIVKENKEDEDYLLDLITRYHWNMAEHNRYSDEDVRECMSYFPIELLKKSGVVL